MVKWNLSCYCPSPSWPLIHKEAPWRIMAWKDSQLSGLILYSLLWGRPQNSRLGWSPSPSSLSWDQHPWTRKFFLKFMICFCNWEICWSCDATEYDWEISLSLTSICITKQMMAAQHNGKMFRIPPTLGMLNKTQAGTVPNVRTRDEGGFCPPLTPPTVRRAASQGHRCATH